MHAPLCRAPPLSQPASLLPAGSVGPPGTILPDSRIVRSFAAEAHAKLSFDERAARDMASAHGMMAVTLKLAVPEPEPDAGAKKAPPPKKGEAPPREWQKQQQP